MLLKCNEFQSGTNLGLVDCTGQSKEGLLERDFDVDILFETKPIYLSSIEYQQPTICNQGIQFGGVRIVGWL
ncbi:MAG: hypothetical protein P0116_09510 [Candidatus Nitrosocosmicus sp.]|nr:hypothetical protein [Candidatus Nitrosocosmicus sp.]